MIRDKHNQTPHVLVEDHYHIRELMDFQDRKADDREVHRERKKLIDDRGDVIRDANLIDLKEFWCSDCKKDFRAFTEQQVELDWSNRSEHVAFYKTKHTCGKWCMRFITDRHKDPYWFRSRKVKMDQVKHAEETLQPYQTGYNMKYKKI